MLVSVGQEYRSYILDEDIKVVDIKKDSFNNERVYYILKDCKTRFLLHKDLETFKEAIRLRRLELIKKEWD